MNEATKRLELTDEQLETVVGGTRPGSNGFSSTFNNYPSVTNSASADQLNLVLGSYLNNSPVGGSTIKQQNPFVQTFNFSFPQQSTPWSW